MLVVDRLTCRFGTKAAVDNASFEIKPGAFVGVIVSSPELPPRRFFFRNCGVSNVPQATTTTSQSDVSATMPVGMPDDPGAMLGALISEKQRERVEAYIKKGVDEGARLVTGGGRPEGLD